MRSLRNSAADTPAPLTLARGAVRILGLDPGLRHTGWGVVDAVDNRLQFIAEGVIAPATTLELSERLRLLYEGVQQLIAAYAPTESAIEETFVNQNPVSTLKLGHARAAAMLAAAVAGLSVAEYKPNLVKKSVVGRGHADKAQVSAMVRILLPGACGNSPDAADALGVAICHAHLRATAQRHAAAVAKAARS
jgi:crossover junction endodeoxyribonuclease RuvC